MDAPDAPLRFASSLPFAGFIAFFCLGLAAAMAFWLLRPWPPRRGHLFACAGATLVCATVALIALQGQTVWIDPVSRVVQMQRGVPGLERVRNHGFTQIDAVVVRRQPDGRFELGLIASADWIRLREHAAVGEAEAEAQGLAALGGWPARRRDYRLDLRARGGDIEGMRTADGREVVGVSLAPLHQLVPDRGAESELR